MEFFDASFWLAVSFFIFIGLTAKPVGRLIGAALDKRAYRIRKELDEAIKLKEEAQAILAEYERGQRTAVEEVEAIIKHAQEEADRITRKAKEELEQEVRRRMDMAEQKIAQAEQTVIQQMRDNAVDITTSAARLLILENINKEAGEKIIGKAIFDLGKKLH